MRNPFAKPLTLSQWLLGSICWTLLCLLSCLLIYFLLTIIFGNDGNASDITYMLLGCLSFWPTHLLIWWRAVKGSPSWLNGTAASSMIFKLVSIIWLMLLIVFQLLACMLFIVFTEIVIGAYWQKKIIW